MNSISLQNVTMRFQETTALEDVTVQFEQGKIYGLLGRNGAGKTTLLSCVTGRLFPQQGRVFIDSEPALENDRALSRVYSMGEKNYYPEGTTVKQLIQWTEDFYPGFDRAYAQDLADQFALNPKKKLKALSTGYLTIAKLVCALATDAPYLLLDEPVLGLDANHRELFYRLLLEDYARKPRTIIVSTHLIEEVADIIEQVVILKQGRLLLDRPADEVKRMGYSVSGKASDVDAWCRGREVLSTDTLGGLKTACLLGSPDGVPPSLETAPLDLQKLFIRLTNA